ncbi:hypothetical protein [Phytomonospora endophytica]|uniref:MFS transporter n=1 Tax=Phytomonospora endophytica TaxID=714109 RepID=A0A841G1X0_9ACTN|nr:hypothetical protein [Phytomonospora endophytica]MBB6039918.1 hypothetical protein [Phytomonospora endophytica]GIG71012.1 hypothetical protein Pen01_73070 [Phytomonospora endophytica]
MTSPTPEEAREALAAVTRQKHTAVDAAYSTPAWYFAMIGGFTLFSGSLYLTKDWVERAWGEPASFAILIGGVLISTTLLAAVSARFVQRRDAVPPGGDFTNNRRGLLITLLVAAVGALVLYFAAYAAIGDWDYALGVMLVAVALTVGAAGKPIQNLMRRRAHRRVDTVPAR